MYRLTPVDVSKLLHVRQLQEMFNTKSRRLAILLLLNFLHGPVSATVPMVRRHGVQSDIVGVVCEENRFLPFRNPHDHHQNWLANSQYQRRGPSLEAWCKDIHEGNCTCDGEVRRTVSHDEHVVRCPHVEHQWFAIRYPMLDWCEFACRCEVVLQGAPQEEGAPTIAQQLADRVPVQPRVQRAARDVGASVAVEDMGDELPVYSAM